MYRDANGPGTAIIAAAHPSVNRAVKLLPSATTLTILRLDFSRFLLLTKRDAN
jgi:hypothetical protein